MGKPRIYLAVKFHSDGRNRELVEAISRVMSEVGVEVSCLGVSDAKYSPSELMAEAFRQIDASNLLLVEFSEKGVGLGVEAGYAYAKNIPVVVVAKRGSEISDSLAGLAKEVIFYENLAGIGEKLAVDPSSIMGVIRDTKGA